MDLPGVYQTSHNAGLVGLDDPLADACPTVVVRLTVLEAVVFPLALGELRRATVASDDASSVFKCSLSRLRSERFAR